MTNKKLIAAVAAFAALVFSGSAQAQYYYAQPYQPEPLYPYVVQPQYVYPPQPQYTPRVRRHAAPAQIDHPQIDRTQVDLTQAQAAPRKRASKTDPELVEELRKGRKEKPVVINKQIIVREKPIIRDHVRIVDEPPIVIQREITEEAAPPPAAGGSRAEQDVTGRVIRAEAEVTILGPDRMSIRLFRKADGSDANAKVIERKKK